MKIILTIGAILCAAAKLYAGETGAPVRDIGAVYQSTSVTIVVSTTPSLILSLGTNNPCVSGYNLGTNPSSNTVVGQYLCGRTYLEIRNDSPNSIWIGPSVNVSSIAWKVSNTRGNPDYGISIPTGTVRIDNDNWPYWYVVAGTTTWPVTIVQKK